MEDNNTSDLQPKPIHKGRKLKKVTLLLLGIQFINMGLLAGQAIGAERYAAILGIITLSLILNGATAWFAFGWINHIVELSEHRENDLELMGKMSKLNFDLLKEITQLHMYSYSQHVKPQPFHGDN